MRVGGWVRLAVMFGEAVELRLTASFRPGPCLPVAHGCVCCGQVLVVLVAAGDDKCAALCRTAVTSLERVCPIPSPSPAPFVSFPSPLC